MKKVNIKIGLVFAVLLAFTNSCKEDFLQVTPNGSLDAQVLAIGQKCQRPSASTPPPNWPYGWSSLHGAAVLR